MKNGMLKKALSLLLALVLVVGLIPTGYAAEKEETPAVSFQDVENTYDVSDLILDSALAEDEKEAEPPMITNEDGEVRVSIVLAGASALEKWNWQTQEVSGNAEIAAYRESLRNGQTTMQAKISRAIGRELDVEWNLTLASNVISAWVLPEEIEEISRMSGVKQVVMETKYEPCVADVGTAQPNMATSSPMIGANAAWAANYTGVGQRIAIIDTGLDTDHQSVDEGAFLYALEEAGGAENVELMDALDVAAAMDQLNIYKGYSNATGQIIADKELTADKLYVSAKVPFGYNYADRSLYLTHDNDEQSGHGSHVAGIAAGNRYLPDGNGGYVSALDTVFSQGVAPDAQLLVMKVFGVTGGGYTSDMVAAVEDALVLGCDSINMSMGSAVAGFTDAALYTEVFERLEDSDTVISISAGNNGAWAENTGHGYLYAEDVNLQTAAEPGTHSAALTVASVENDGMIGKTFQVGDQAVTYAEVQMYGRPNLLSSLDTSVDGSGTELEYVHLDTYGNEYNYEGINVMGKVVIVSRGNGMMFKDIHSIAARKGAIAVVVYNNEPGPGMKMDVTGSGVDIPIVGITQKDGQAIKAASKEELTDDGWDTPYYTGKMTVYKDAADSAVSLNSEYYTMSSFSSWGVPGTLSIKPEITAPGGNIYSINGETAETDQYITMSGTSMAAPQAAGMAAVLAQYLDETGLDEKTGLSQRHLIQNLLMSTATPILDGSTGLPYSLMQQGAGLANLEAALNAESYVTVDGRTDDKVKAELGDDPGREGVYTFDYTIHNFTDKAQNYVLDGKAYTQDYFEDKASFKNSSAGKTWYMDYTLKALDAAVSFAVDGQTLTADNAGDLPDFDGDNDADRADAQALLDYATGKRTTLAANQDKADLSGDGKTTAYDAELYLAKLGDSTLLVPANGSVTVTVTIRLSDADKAELDKVYTNGAYIEAWVTAAPLADAEGKVASTHTIPVLAFYGSWSEPSMFDQMTYSQLLSGSYTNDSYFTSSVPVAKQRNFNYVTVKLNDLAGETYLGGNPFIEGDTYNPDRNAISSTGRIVSMNWSLIRNAADFRAAVEGPDGAAYYESIRSQDDPTGGWDYAAAYVPNIGAWYYVSSSQALDEENGGWQPENIENGTELTVKLQAAPEYYLKPTDGTHGNPWVDWNDISSKNALSISVAVDNEAPELEVYAEDYSDWGGEKTIYVSVQDNRYTAAVLLMTPKGGTRLDAKAVNQKNKGESVTLTFDVTDIWGTEFQIIAVDYAGNMTTKQAQVGYDEYYGPSAALLGPTTDTGSWPDMSASAQWDGFDSNTNLDYKVEADANTGAYAAAYGDGYLFYVGYMRKDGKLNYNLYALDYPDMETPILVGESVSGYTSGATPIRSMTYVPENGGRLYYIASNPPMQDGTIENYQLRALDVATGQNVGYTYYFPEYGDLFKLTPSSLAYSPDEGVFYLIGYENGYDGKHVNLYKFELPTDSAEIWVEYEQEIGIVYSDEAEEWDIDPDLALSINPDRTSIAVGEQYGDPVVYLSLRSSDGARDYLYTYYYGDMTNTGLVRAHNSMVVLPDAWEENAISRDTAVELKLNAPATEVFQGGFLQLGVTLRPWCLANKNLTWTSSNENVATVDGNGRVTGVAEGAATITVTTVAAPNLTQSVEITVKAPEFKVSFTGTGTDGLSRMATYDFKTGMLTEGAALTDMDGNPIVSAASDLGNYGSLWVQDQTEGEYRLHKIDPETGRSSFDSEISSTGSKAQPRLFNDISYDDGDSSTDDSEWIFATDGEGRIWCTQNREKPNTMMYVMEQESAPMNFIGITFGEAFDVDGTRFYPSYYLELSSNKLILNNFSYSELMGWSSTYTYFKLSEQLEYLTGANGRYLDTLTYDPVTNSPVLLHYNGASYDVYWLSLDTTAKTATMLNLGTITGYRDMAGYTAEYYGAADSTENAALTALNAAGKDAAVPMKAVPTGSLNAVSTTGTEVAENTAYATLTITAEQAAASGMITVTLDENLELVSLTSPVELNSYQQNDRTITFGYAATADVAQGGTLAVLRLKQAEAEAEAAVTETERGGVSMDVSETVTFPYDAGTAYTLTYDVNGGREENRVETQTAKETSYTFTVSDFVPTRNGFTFLGWAENAAASMPNYASGSKITLTEDAPSKTLYAVWKDFRTPAQNALEDYYAALLQKNNYTDEGKAELERLLEEGLAEIAESLTEADAQDLLAQYQAWMDAVAVKEPEPEPEPEEPVFPVLPVVPGGSNTTKPANEMPFTDVNTGDWFYNDVKYVYENGIMNGVSDTRFAPQSTLTRAMVVTILYRMEGEPSTRYNALFPDVTDNQWYTKGVEWAANNGIVLGYTSGKFGPNDPVTREQLAAILYRYAQSKNYVLAEGSDLSAYADAASISPYAVSAVKWAVTESLLEVSNGKLLPRENATRAEVAHAIAGFCQHVSK